MKINFIIFANTNAYWSRINIKKVDQKSDHSVQATHIIISDKNH